MYESRHIYQKQERSWKKGQMSSSLLHLSLPYTSKSVPELTVMHLFSALETFLHHRLMSPPTGEKLNWHKWYDNKDSHKETHITYSWTKDFSLWILYFNKDAMRKTHSLFGSKNEANAGIHIIKGNDSWQKCTYLV